MTEKDVNGLKPVIKPKIALKAIHHVKNRVEQFNNQYFPLEMKLVGIGGSCIRSENPKDIDLFVEAYTIQKRWEEWKKFTECLNLNIYKLDKLAFDSREIERKATTNRMIEMAKDKLLALDFKEVWIANWFPWVRISDIKWGLDRGLPLVYFSENELISRYIKDGWKGKRLEIHISFFDPDGNEKSSSGDVPFLTIWRVGEGIVIPSKKDIEIFLQDEHNKLSKLSKEIILILESKKDQSHWEIPQIYHPTIRIIKDKGEDEHFKNLRIEFKSLTTVELEEIKKLVEINNKLPETNTRLRECLKRFAMIGQVYEKIMNIEHQVLLKTLKTDNIYTHLSDILTKRLRPLGYWKKDVEALLKAMDSNALAHDLEKISSCFKKSD
jgi:hypothetical protein